MNKTKSITIFGMIFLLLIVNVISAVSIEDVSTYPAQAEPGQTVEVSINIENINNFDIENVKVTLNLNDVPFAPYQSSSERFLDELDKGDDEDFDFEIIVLPDTESGIYKIPVQITYKDKDENNFTKQELISVTVNSIPELKISLEDSVTLIKGKENVISIRITNSGLSNAKFLYIALNEASGVKILSEKEQYIGNIDSDDFDSVDYNILINAGASSTINLPVTLTFRDSTNKLFTETKNLNLNVYSIEDAQKLGLIAKPNYTIYLGIGIVVVFYFIYRIRKNIKRKRKQKEGR